MGELGNCEIVKLWIEITKSWEITELNGSNGFDRQYWPVDVPTQSSQSWDSLASNIQFFFVEFFSTNHDLLLFESYNSIRFQRAALSTIA